MEVLSSRILLRPADLDRSLAFYRDVLRLPIYREWAQGGSRGYVFFLGGGFLELSGRGLAAAPGNLEVWLQVRDLEGTYGELLEGGVEVLAPPELKPWGLLEMPIRDPDGNVLLLVQVPDDHPLRRRS